jgi:hypothetical protein
MQKSYFNVCVSSEENLENFSSFFFSFEVISYRPLSGLLKLFPHLYRHIIAKGCGLDMILGHIFF